MIELKRLSGRLPPFYRTASEQKEVPMYPLMEEILVEEHRQEVRREVGQIHLEEQALRGRVYRPNWFTGTMQRLGQWLIARGEELVKRYQSPARPCQSSGQRYAN